MASARALCGKNGPHGVQLGWAESGIRDTVAPGGSSDRVPTGFVVEGGRAVQGTVPRTGRIQARGDEAGSSAPDEAKVRGRMKQDTRRDLGGRPAERPDQWQKDGGQRIGKGTRIVGRVTGDGDLTVEGRIEGELGLRGRLVVATGGLVAAPVQVESVVVEGTIEGDVDARDAVQLRPSGSVQGSIRAQRFSLEDGARFTGRIDMDVDLPDELADPRAETGR